MSILAGHENSPNLYSGERGSAYYAHRKASRSDTNQQRRSYHFKDLADSRASILDFGCGNGGLLASLPANHRVGIEIGPEAAEEAKGRLDAVHPSLAFVQADSIDVAISFHALEHVYNPQSELAGIFKALKPGGRFRFIVPYEGSSLRQAAYNWSSGDTDFHLYSWTPLTFGNLLAATGFEVERVRLAPMNISARLKSRAVAWAKGLWSHRLQVVADGRRP